MKRVLLLILLLLLAATMYVIWRKQQTQISDQEIAPPPKPVLSAKSPSPPLVQNNDNYIEPIHKKDDIQPIQSTSPHWIKDYAATLMEKHNIHHAHRDIFKSLHNYIVKSPKQHVEESELLYIIFSQCPILSPKKLDLAAQIVWKSQNQQHIDHVYETIIAIASDRNEDAKTRANAIEVLLRSNNRLYMERSKRILENLQEHERIQEMEQIRQRMERIQNVIQERIPINPSTLRRQSTQPQPRPHVPLTADEAQVQHILIDQYRRLERRAYNAMKHKTSVYDDPQNVHNHRINQSVIDSVQTMMDKEPTNNNNNPLVLVDNEIQLYYPHYAQHKDKITNSLHRIRNDPSKFKGGATISQVFDMIVVFISSSPHKAELWKRMGEELVEMNHLCATGHLSRLVNVVQGFGDDFQIKMDPQDEIYANLSNYITMQIQNSGNSDELLTSMIDPHDHQLYNDFLCLVLKPKVAELKEEYKNLVSLDDFDRCIHTSLRNYIKNESDANFVIQSITTSNQ